MATESSKEQPLETYSAHERHFRALKELRSQGCRVSSAVSLLRTSIMGLIEGTQPHRARAIPVASHERTMDSTGGSFMDAADCQ